MMRSAKEWLEQQDQSIRDTLCQWMQQHCSDQEVELEVQVSLTAAQFQALKQQFCADGEWNTRHVQEKRVDTFLTNTVRRSEWPLQARDSITVAKTPIGKTSIRTQSSSGPALHVACKREHMLATPNEVQRAVELSSALPFSTGSTTRTITRDSFTHPLNWLQVSFSSVVTQPQQQHQQPLHTYEVEIEATMCAFAGKQEDRSAKAWTAEQRIWMLIETDRRIQEAASAVVQHD
jgi:hypothetical protein